MPAAISVQMSQPARQTRRAFLSGLSAATAEPFRIQLIPIDVGNSGTSLYLAAGLAALADCPVQFTGDEQIQRRPAKALLDALSDLGTEVTITGKDGCPPFTVTGPLCGGENLN